VAEDAVEDLTAGREPRDELGRDLHGARVRPDAIDHRVDLVSERDKGELVLVDVLGRLPQDREVLAERDEDGLAHVGEGHLVVRRQVDGVLVRGGLRVLAAGKLDGVLLADGHVGRHELRDVADVVDVVEGVVLRVHEPGQLVLVPGAAVPHPGADVGVDARVRIA
jgi:hypothetical protein